MVLVDESAAGDMSSDRLARPERDDDIIVGCALVEAPVGSVGVVVLDVVAQKPLEVLTVPNEGAVAELAAHGPHPPFRVRVRDWCRGGIRMIVVPWLRKTSSNASTNCPAPSRIKNRIVRS